MLQLDEKHDFVGTVEAWFPNEQFEKLTAEAWIYFEEPLEPRTFWTIIGQEGRFGLLLIGISDVLGVWGYSEGADSNLISGVRSLSAGKWVHVVAIYDASAGMGFDGRGGNLCCPGGHLIRSDKTLRIGGIVPQDVENRSHFRGKSLKFRGYIDEVRISNIVRYKGPEWQVPKGNFTVDEHTISLWHFDEAHGASRFKDASGNGYHLWRSGAMAVEAQRKLTTIWGQLKK
jgi:hypothetical protein